MEPFTFFISYRRYTAPIALLLKYEIEKRIQFARVFVDVEEVRLGDSFPDRIREMIDRAHVMIVLIGKNWMPNRRESQLVPTAPNGESPISIKDWVVSELEYSKTSALNYNEENRYGQSKRITLPIFVDCDRRFDQFELPGSITYIAEIQSEGIDYASWPVTIGPLIERIAIKLKLKKRPDADEYPNPDRGKARTQPLPDQELIKILGYEDYEGWYLDNYGNAEVRYLVKTFKFPHFNHAADFMELISNHCRILDHHPEWRNVFNHVTVSLTTWDARRHVTIYDLNLALFMNKAAAAIIARRQNILKNA
jgi:pterin-4a-carbinolamine dehydratase